MRTLSLLVLLALGSPSVLLAQAPEKPPADYVAAMKELAAFAQAMTKPGAETDLDATRPWVAKVRDAFGLAQKFWTDRNQDGRYFPEINATVDAIKAASDMGVAVNLQSPEGVGAAVKDIVGHCQPCHDKRRIKADDGSYLIKP